MTLSSSGFSVFSEFHRYHTHIFVFFVALFIGLTVAHPSILLNDEFITANQLHQLHAGHQILINEGKYGLQPNGSMSGYFAVKSNLLGYTLIYPIISIPAYWMIDLSGENCVYLILCLWTLVSIILLLMISRYYPEYSCIRNVRWIPAAFFCLILLFFINLRFYSSFPIDTYENFPEIIALVFTNVVLLAITSVLIFEINRSIFEDTLFSFFGTLVCLFSSSYFVWVTHGKDHILVLSLFVGIFLCLIRLVRTRDYWYLSLAFLLCGLLAWVRPEVALWVFLAVGIIWLYSIIQSRSVKEPRNNRILIASSPLFTVIGALPFFLNNYMITKNFLLPVSSIYQSSQPFYNITNATKQIIPATGAKSVTSSFQIFFTPTTSITPASFINDVAGIFFYPDNGSISITGIIPLFIVMAIVCGTYLWLKKILLSPEESKYIGICLLLSLSVFLAYVPVIHILYSDHGIVPDIRYLSPLYLPLTITGLILARKLDLFPRKPADCIKWLSVICISGGILSLVFLPMAYGPNAFEQTIGVPIGKFFSIYILALCVLTAGTILIGKYYNKGSYLCEYLVLLLCLVPFFWQINSTFIFRSFNAYAGYTFWIPVVRVGWELIVNLILLKTINP